MKTYCFLMAGLIALAIQLNAQTTGVGVVDTAVNTASDVTKSALATVDDNAKRSAALASIPSAAASTLATVTKSALAAVDDLATGYGSVGGNSLGSVNVKSDATVHGTVTSENLSRALIGSVTVTRSDIDALTADIVTNVSGDATSKNGSSVTIGGVNIADSKIGPVSFTSRIGINGSVSATNAASVAIGNLDINKTAVSSLTVRSNVDVGGSVRASNASILSIGATRL